MKALTEKTWVPLSALFSSLVILSGAILWMASIEHKASLAAQAVVELKDQRRIDDNLLRQEIQNLRKSIEKLDGKIDRLIERGRL